MANTFRRDGRPDALSRLRSTAPPWMTATHPVLPRDRATRVVDAAPLPRPTPVADPAETDPLDTVHAHRPGVAIGRYAFDRDTIGADEIGADEVDIGGVDLYEADPGQMDPRRTHSDGLGPELRIDDDLAPPARPEVRWELTTSPAWLGHAAPAEDVRATAPDPVPGERVRRPRRRGPSVAPPAAIALIAVGVVACIVTAYTVFRGPSGDSPAAARVAFPASAGPAARVGPVAPSDAAERAGASSSARPSAGAVPPTLTGELVVSVVGLVRTPGLVRVSPTARVADAIGRAGGGRPGADLLSLNMAQPLHDGDQILVGYADPGGGAGLRSAIVAAGSGGGVAASTGTPPASAGGSTPAGDPGAPVDLNTADEAALDGLPGVGPVTAKAIIDWRSRNGRFTSVDQLGEVDGIGPGRLAKLRDRVTV